MEENELNTDPFHPAEEPQTETAESWQTLPPARAWLGLFVFGFALLIFYIYHSHHTTKAIRTKRDLSAELKELHAEKISLESSVTNASKRSEVVKKVAPTGLKDLTTPPIKIERNHERD
jgi:hypothetical protein